MLKGDYLKEVFPPSHLNEKLSTNLIYFKCVEEQEEVEKEIFSKNYEDAAQECLDAARMYIELFRRCCKEARTQEHHQIQNHLRKLEERGTIEL